MKSPQKRQYIFLNTCILLFGLLAAASVQASSIIFQPNIFTIPVGRTFTVPIVIDPAGKPQYTVRIFLTFPPDQLEVIAFVFGQKWLQVPQPGYDSLNNTRGEVIKTGGFPGGFSAPAAFGTITFRAKGPGDSAIVAGSQTFVLNAQNTNTLEFRPQIRVVAAGGTLPSAPVGGGPTPSTQPLPNLSVTGEKNIFDISLTPEQAATQPTLTFFILFFCAALLLGIIGRFAVVWLRRRSVIKKLTHDKDAKN